MNIKDLVPRFGRNVLPIRREEADPFRDFQRQMNRLFDDFFGDFPVMDRGREPGWAAAGFVPRVDISETDQEVRVSAELPGMDEKDITVELRNDMLTIRGEKKSEQDERGRNWHRREQIHGSFQRSLGLPAGVETEKAKAQFRKGVLTVTVPKREGEELHRHMVPIEEG